MEVIVVPRLDVSVVTGEPKDDPYGQGFSAIFAAIETSDADMASRLRAVHRSGDTVTLRCAMLDVTGPITKVDRNSGVTKFILSVRQVCYRDPFAERDG